MMVPQNNVGATLAVALFFTGQGKPDPYMDWRIFFAHRRGGYNPPVFNWIGLQSLRHLLRKCHLPLHKGGCAPRCLGIPLLSFL